MKTLLIIAALLYTTIASASWTAQATYPMPSGRTRNMVFGYVPVQNYSFDAIAIRVVEGHLGVDPLTIYNSPTWSMCLDTPTEVAICGNLLPESNARFTINFADYYNVPLTFDLVMFNGDNIVVNQRVQNNPVSGFWTIGTPGSGQWLPTRNEIPEPVSCPLLAAGLLGLRRKK